MKIMKNQKGQTAIEYALIALVLLSIVIVAMKGPLQTALSTIFGKVSTKASAVS